MVRERPWENKGDKMTSREKWLGNWCSAQLFALLAYHFYDDVDGYPRNTPWVIEREKEIRQRIKAWEAE